MVNYKNSLAFDLEITAIAIFLYIFPDFLYACIHAFVYLSMRFVLLKIIVLILFNFFSSIGLRNH